MGWSDRLTMCFFEQRDSFIWGSVDISFKRLPREIIEKEKQEKAFQCLLFYLRVRRLITQSWEFKKRFYFFLHVQIKRALLFFYLVSDNFRCGQWVRKYLWFSLEWLLLLLLLLLLLFLARFHISLSWWSFSGTWVTASLIRSPGLFLVFRLILVWMVSARPSISKSSRPHSGGANYNWYHCQPHVP